MVCHPFATVILKTCFEQKNGSGSHCFRIMDIYLKGGFNLGVPQPNLNILRMLTLLLYQDVH